MLKTKFYIISIMLLLTAGSVAAQDSLPALIIDNDDITVLVGDTVKINITYVFEDESKFDTTAVLSILPEVLGHFTEDGSFIADSAGKGWIYAVLDSLSDSVEVEIKIPDNEETEFPKLVIDPESYDMSPGDSVSLQAYYLIDDSTSVDTIVAWSSDDTDVATINDTGFVLAIAPGHAKITAEAGSLKARASINVKENKDYDSSATAFELYVEPGDTLIDIGESVAFSVYYKSEDGGKGEPVNGNVTWNMQGMPVGTISDSGELTADSAGFALVFAELEDGETGSAFVIVSDPGADSELNNITITRSSPNPRGYSVMKKITEGELWRIGGLPNPLNVLNGGGLYFPVGSLHEDIRIHIELPKFAETEGDSVNFGNDSIVTAASFQVYVDDTLSEPYYFDTPLIASLIFKRGLLNKLGIDPATLTLYYAEYYGDTLTFDEQGLDSTTIDLERNLIYSSVAHFSTLVLAGKPNTLTNLVENTETVTGYSLSQNYPNPFNPSTTINYSISGNGTANVQIKVFDMLGREIATLINRRQAPGYYSIKWNASSLASGIYYYRIKSGKFVQTKKMILLK